MKNFTASIIAATMLGYQAHAARDAFAAHRMALEAILDEVHHDSYEHAPEHHERRIYAHEDVHEDYDHPVEHVGRHYVHEDIHEDYDHHPVEHEHVHYHEPHHVDTYDAFDHDYDTEHSEHVTYRHHGDDEYVDEYAQGCGLKPFCQRFS